MLAIFLDTLPFFAIVGLGYWTGATGFFTQEATAFLTKFVFFFALPAMLFRFTAGLSLGEVLDWTVIGAFMAGSMSVFILGVTVARLRGLSVPEMAVEAQCCTVGNVGFLGIPMLSLLFGEASLGPNMLVLLVDTIFFASLMVILINAGRDGKLSLRVFQTAFLGLVRNPMIMSIFLGVIWSALALPMPDPADSFLTVLGSAATPCALFAIGASLAGKSAERLSVAGWISFCKLVLHPAAVAFFAIVVFEADPFASAVIIAAAALPVAGNIFIQAQHYGVAPSRTSASILVSTALSIVTVSAVIGWVMSLIQ